VGLVEVIYSYAVSTHLFKEQVRAIEILGMALVLVGIVVVSVAR